jgi:hypothetical protein
MVTRSLLTCIDLSLQLTAISEIPNHGKRIVCIFCTINTKYWNELQLTWRVRVNCLFSELSTVNFEIASFSTNIFIA